MGGAGEYQGGEIEKQELEIERQDVRATTRIPKAEPRRLSVYVSN